MKAVNAVLLSIRINCIVAGAISSTSWFCGPAGGFAQKISYSIMNQNCQDNALQVNHCCAKHDECYNIKRGRILCDQEFCACLTTSSLGAELWCQVFISSQCFVVNSFGEEAYKKARGLERAKATKIFPKATEGFDEIYDNCPNIKKILISCAIIFNSCYDGAIDSTDCTRDIVECVDDGVAYNPTPKCIETVQKVFPTSVARQKLKSAARDIHGPSIEAISETKTVTVLTTSAVFVCCVISLVACLLYINRTKRDDQTSMERNSIQENDNPIRKKINDVRNKLPWRTRNGTQRNSAMGMQEPASDVDDNVA